MLKVLLLSFSLLMTTGSLAKDLGQDGKTYPIAEQDFKQFIDQKLNHLKQSGELAAYEHKTDDRIISHIVHLPNLGIPRAEEEKTFYLSAAVTVSKAIFLPNGKQIAYKGQVINPLDFVHLKESFLFFDGSDRAQVAWVKANRHRFKSPELILTGGNLVALSNEFGRLYYDKNGRLTQHFSITQLPAVVTQVRHKWQIAQYRSVA